VTQFNDCKLAYFKLSGATSDTLPDAKRQWLVLQGFPPEHNTDMFFNYLESQGYEGSYSDMQAQFWRDNNCLA